MSNLAVALMLAEVYQNCGRSESAIELLESLGSLSPTAEFALSLAELYFEREQWQDVSRVTEGFETNEDDLTAQLLAIRAHALGELNMPEAALTVAKEALRFKKRRPETLRFARYIRAGSYEQLGRRAQARKEPERIYAEDARYADVAQRLGVSPPKESSPPRPDA
jgi:tetratricopeptide (TPR) repeat protein